MFLLFYHFQNLFYLRTKYAICNHDNIFIFPTYTYKIAAETSSSIQ